MVVERSSDKHFEVRPEQSLLDAMEAADLPIVSGCRMGMCGSDPVFVVDGMNNLQPPDENEITTLKRLGLEGKARMACCCKPVGDIAIDLAASPDDLNTQNNGPEHNRADIDIDLRLKVVIIGNGIAGISTAEHLRELDTDCSISLISREPHHFYNRMGLEQVIYGRTAMQGLYLMQPDWYQRNAIDVWLNTQVELIHRDARQISLATGETLPYDKLIIATGGSAFVPPVTGFDLPGCFTLRNAEDALHLRAWIQQYRCKQATVLGGGVLGVEAASALHQLGLRVSIIQHSHQLMNMQLDLHAAVILKKFLENSGIKILTGTGIEHAEGEERIKKIILSNGNIMATDILVICTGIRANTQLANECGLQINRGIIVDEYMRTSDENIYCVGDAAELPGTITGLWAVGNEQGKIAAAHITGEGNSYKNTAIPPVQLKVPGIDLKSFGTFDENGNAESYTNGDIDKYCWKHILIDDGKITAGVFVNAPQAAGAAIASSRNNSKKLSSEDLEAIMKMN